MAHCGQREARVTPQQWERLKTLYAEAENYASREKAALLDQIDAEDPAIGTQLRALLAQGAPTDDFLEQPVARVADVAAASATANSPLHSRRDALWPGEFLEGGELL